MRPNPDPTDLSGQLLDLLKRVNEFTGKDIPRESDRDEFSRWMDDRDDLRTDVTILVEGIREAMDAHSLG